MNAYGTAPRAPRTRTFPPLIRTPLSALEACSERSSGVVNATHDWRLRWMGWIRGRRLLPAAVDVARLAVCALLCLTGRTQALAGEPPSAGRDADVLFRIQAAVDAIRVIDTHEHLRTEEAWLSMVDPAYWFGGYLGQDLRSAGMKGSPKGEPPQQWEAIQPYWPMVRLGGYAQAIRLARARLAQRRGNQRNDLADLGRASQGVQTPGLLRTGASPARGRRPVHLGCVERGGSGPGAQSAFLVRSRPTI